MPVNATKDLYCEKLFDGLKKRLGTWKNRSETVCSGFMRIRGIAIRGYFEKFRGCYDA